MCARIAWSAAEKKYRKAGDSWVLKESVDDETLDELIAGLFQACPSRSGKTFGEWMGAFRTWATTKAKAAGAGVKELLGYRRRLEMIKAKMAREAVEVYEATGEGDNWQFTISDVNELLTYIDKLLAARKNRQEGEESVEIQYFDTNIYEGAIVEAVEGGEFAVREAEDGGKYLEAILIAPGFSKNTVKTQRKTYQRHYGEPILRETAPRLDGMEIYIGYDEHNDPLDYPKEFGVWRNSRFEESRGIRGDIHVYPDQYWVLDRFKVNPNTLKLSIEGNGGYRYGVLEGRPTADVVKLDIERARLVKRPAAGGAITGIRESEAEIQGGDFMDKLTLEELKESYPGVYKAARDEFLSEADVKAKDARIKELEEAAEKEKAKYTELETKLNEAKSVELIEAAFPEDLPDAAKEKLRESLKDKAEGLDLTVEKDVKVYESRIAEAVKAEADYIATLAEAGKVKGMGGGAADKKRETFVESQTNEVLKMAGVKLDEAEDKK